MTLRQIEVFSKVAKLKSFTEAGEDLDVSRSSISVVISALERQLKTKLFERLGNKVQLTDAGEELLNAAQEILRRTESIKAKMAEAAGSKKNRNDL